MEYQKIINLLDNTPNQPSKLKTKNCVKKKDESRGTYDKNNQINVKINVKLKFMWLQQCIYNC